MTVLPVVAGTAVPASGPVARAPVASGETEVEWVVRGRVVPGSEGRGERVAAGSEPAAVPVVWAPAVRERDPEGWDRAVPGWAAQGWAAPDPARAGPAEAVRAREPDRAGSGPVGWASALATALATGRAPALASVLALASVDPSASAQTAREVPPAPARPERGARPRLARSTLPDHSARPDGRCSVRTGGSPGRPWGRPRRAACRQPLACPAAGWVCQRSRGWVRTPGWRCQRRVWTVPWRWATWGWTCWTAARCRPGQQAGG